MTDVDTHAHSHTGTGALGGKGTVEYKNKTKKRKTPYAEFPLVSLSRDEREEDKRYGRPHRGAYRYIIGDAPVCRPGDTMTAIEHHSRIMQALEMTGWSPSERNKLRRMEKVWARRVGGVDVRFEIVGTRPGGLSKREKQMVEDWGKVCVLVSLGTAIQQGN